MTINIQLVLSNHLFCEGIKKLVNETGSGLIFNDVHENSSAFDADIVLFDAKRDIDELIHTHPGAKFVLVDTGLKETDLACLLLCYHISGIIPQDTDLTNFIKALNVIYGGDVWIDQRYLKILIKKGKTLPEGDGIKGLSAQDMRIVELISLGYKNSQIADELCLSEVTIKAHVSKIFKMLKVKNRTQLACLAWDSDPPGP